MLHRTLMVTLAALVLGSSGVAQAEPHPDAGASNSDPAPAQGDNLLQLGVEVGWGQGATVMYERTIYRFFGVRAGYSAMALPVFCLEIFDTNGCNEGADFTAAHGPSVDLVFRTLGEHAFEVSRADRLAGSLSRLPLPAQGLAGRRPRRRGREGHPGWTDRGERGLPLLRPTPLGTA